MKQKLQDMNEQQLARAIKLNKYKIVVDIFLIIVIALIGFYIFKSIAYIKIAESMSKDYCLAHLEKIGMECFVPRYFP